MNWKVAILGLLPVAGLVSVLAIGFNHDPRALPDMLKGKPAPEFTLQSLDGKQVSLKEFQGRPVLLNFWSTWCEPCKYEYDLLQDAAHHYGDKAQVLGVIYQDAPENVAAYLKARKNYYPHLVDPNSETAIRYGLSGVPESYLIDAKGQVALKHVGIMTPDLLRNVFDPLVAKATQ